MALVSLLMGMCNAQGQCQQTGYPITQVPFTSVKIEAGTFWGNRIKAVRDVTISLAFSKSHARKNRPVFFLLYEKMAIFANGCDLLSFYYLCRTGNNWTTS